MANEQIAAALLQAAASINPYERNPIGGLAKLAYGGLQGFQNQRMANETQGLSYGQLAEYWAQRGDVEKAKQYAELDARQKPQVREVFARSENVIDPQTGQSGMLLTYRNGEQEFKPIQYSPNAQPSGRAPATPRVPVGMMWDAAQGRAVPIPGVPQKPVSVGKGSSLPVSPKGLPPVEKSKLEAKANMFAMARNNIDKLSDIVRTAAPAELADPRSPVGAQAASLATQIQDAYRVMADLGVINEADVPRIENVVPGATSLPTIAKGKPAALEKYRIFGEQLDQSLANIGYRRKPVSEQPKTTDYTSKYGLKPRGQ